MDVDSEFGDFVIDPSKVRSIRFDGEGQTSVDDSGTTRPGSVIVKDGRKFSGLVKIPSDWMLETDLGDVMLKAGRLKSISFQGPAENPQDSKPTARPEASQSQKITDEKADFERRVKEHGGLGP